jgi:Family of unknown function (DUF6496)
MAKHRAKKAPMTKKKPYNMEVEVEIERSSKHKKPKPSKPALKTKMEKVMHEFGEGALHSGSKKGPVVTNPKQALAIGYSEARKLKKKK